MANFAETNPFLARLRKTPHRVDYYARTRDALSLERARTLACARAENLSKAAEEGRYKQRARIRYLLLRRKVAKTYGVELDADLLTHLRDYFDSGGSSGHTSCMRTAHSFVLKVEGRRHKMSRAGEGLLKACVWAYEAWKEREVDCQRWSGIYRVLAKGKLERRRFARLRWKRLRVKWGVIGMLNRKRDKGVLVGDRE